MPKKGYHVITVHREIYRPIQKLAKQNRRSIARQLEVILEKAGVLSRRKDKQLTQAHFSRRGR